MLLEAIGVEREAIMHDYLLSNDHVAGDIEQQRQRLMVHFQLPDHMSPPDGVVSALMGVSAEYLEVAYAAIHQQFTTVDGYLAAAGITPTKREQLTHLLCRG
jgi:protein-tyrosine phosphatase